jgi:hypothetical protein
VTADEARLQALQTLDVPATATPDEIKAAYRDLVKVWHPDRYQNESDRLRRRAEEQMKRVTWAYEQLLGSAPPAEKTARAPLVMDFGQRWGYIDETGATVIEPQFDEAREFVSGLAAVRIYDKWGFVNPAGNLPVTPLYEAASDFSEGLAAVQWYGRWGYIDAGGAFVIPPRFQEAGPFREGYAEVRLGARRGRLARDGRVDFDPFTSGRHIEG